MNGDGAGYDNNSFVKQHWNRRPPSPPLPSGLRIKENKEVYEGEVTELTPEYTEAAAAGQGAGAGYGKVRAGGV